MVVILCTLSCKLRLLTCVGIKVSMREREDKCGMRSASSSYNEVTYRWGDDHDHRRKSLGSEEMIDEQQGGRQRGDIDVTGSSFSDAERAEADGCASLYLQCRWRITFGCMSRECCVREGRWMRDRVVGNHDAASQHERVDDKKRTVLGRMMLESAQRTHRMCKLSNTSHFESADECETGIEC